ncbi:magnesium and cobalt transport protein CorA [Aurantibacter crassamenti]|uniref:magnesium and cobalt transport protein CorA n=1 Tax=Aurantibacter crassamenti TaxID=1837375 RepID=UPI0019399701|nr:magnesium and cobalt transport protein CorA [Aurantibacter crassamenti]MBM1106861.1 magnesium and cobalt transport protein CorA [Aurantibacter crassamenti]
MRRKNRRKANPYGDYKEVKLEEFLSDFSLIRYDANHSELKNLTGLESINIKESPDTISWLNIYGFQYAHQIKKIVAQNGIDEFLSYLILDNNHRNKVIELNQCFFLTLKSPYYSEDKEEVKFEQLVFIVGDNYVWSVQEVYGDHFEHIRSRLRDNLGVVRKKGADYLFFLLIEAIIDNYYSAFEKLNEDNIGLDNPDDVRPTPEFARLVENQKRQLYQIKRASTSLNEALSHLQLFEFEKFNKKYFDESREQVKMLTDEIDHKLQHLESSINLMFSIQNHRLNEVMRTLTIFSVIFIPLTFLAGIYGMNFENMPELKSKNGYFIVLGVMLLIVLGTVYFIKRKKWSGK